MKKCRNHKRTRFVARCVQAGEKGVGDSGLGASPFDTTVSESSISTELESVKSTSSSLAMGTATGGGDTPKAAKVWVVRLTLGTGFNGWEWFWVSDVAGLTVRSSDRFSRMFKALLGERSGATVEGGSTLKFVTVRTLVPASPFAPSEPGSLGRRRTQLSGKSPRRPRRRPSNHPPSGDCLDSTTTTSPPAKVSSPAFRATYGCTTSHSSTSDSLAGHGTIQRIRDNDDGGVGCC